MIKGIKIKSAGSETRQLVQGELKEVQMLKSSVKIENSMSKSAI